ncbi:MAG: helix-turn-helix domain-containing protein [Bdellovibrionales bacterium]|nr:helix-turn-helix domain-containing protein [Bdellovibrionales bacterium]
MNNSFVKILREYLEEEQKKNPFANETTLAKKMDIPPTTFNRLLNGYSKPSVNTALKLSQFIPELKKSLPEEILQMLKLTMDKEDFESMGKALATFLSEKHFFLCWILAFSNKGVTEEEIEDQFGKQGIRALRILEKNSLLLKEEDNHYRVNTDGEYKGTGLSFKLIKTHLIFLAKQYKPDNSKNNYIQYWVESLNEKGQQELMKAHHEFHKRVRRIMNSEDNRGSIPMFSIACSDSLLGQ